tara:strand:+ start:811 stop:1278 length:468 start_codon:yes stop_codon:yes gene_type:complete
MNKVSDPLQIQLILEQFIPYRLSILTNIISSSLSDTYKEKFQLSITEWRILAVLGEYPGVSADEVSTKTQMEKSSLSRAIAKLILRKLIQREFSQIDQRRSILTLTESGLSIYNKVVPLAVEFERQLLKCFSGSEYEQFSKLLERYRDANGCIFH